VVIDWLKENVKGSGPWIEKMMETTAEVETLYGYR
jgi:hypothetical protein